MRTNRSAIMARRLVVRLGGKASFAACAFELFDEPPRKVGPLPPFGEYSAWWPVRYEACRKGSLSRSEAAKHGRTVMAARHNRRSTAATRIVVVVVGGGGITNACARALTCRNGTDRRIPVNLLFEGAGAIGVLGSERRKSTEVTEYFQKEMASTDSSSSSCVCGSTPCSFAKRFFRLTNDRRDTSRSTKSADPSSYVG